MCYAHLANFAEALAQITTAKQFAGTERDLMLQIGIAEAATHVLTAEYQTACDLYQHIAATYSDLLAEDRESAQEFQERFGYALVHVKRYDEAIRIFQQLLSLGPVLDEQRVRLFLGAALAAKGRTQQARIELDLAAKGPDPELSKDALDRIMSQLIVQ
jgi:tetratricopeptide (TPR) repeat protein